MGSMQQAVLEFDEEVQAPWRPRLVVARERAATDTATDSATDSATHSTSGRTPLSRPNRRSPSRVGVCRPPSSPAPPARRPASPRPEVWRTAPTPGARLHPSEPRRALPAGRLRLTRRARRLAIVVALVVGMALGSWVDHLLGDDAGGLRLAGESVVVVQPGDTLWSIASSLERGGDVRVLIDEIQALNGLADAELHPGRTLLLP